jgi:hypothetical protein
LVIVATTENFSLCDPAHVDLDQFADTYQKASNRAFSTDQPGFAGANRFEWRHGLSDGNQYAFASRDC